MRDHTKLRAFGIADEFVLAVYAHTRGFPPEERYGLGQQLRRAALSVVSNIVEGCARSSVTEYLRFLHVAYGSAKEAGYQISLAHRLQFIEHEQGKALEAQADTLAKTLNALIGGIRRTQSPEPKA